MFSSSRGTNERTAQTESFGTDVPWTSRGYSGGRQGSNFGAGPWKNKHLGVDIQDRTRGRPWPWGILKKLEAEELRADFSFPKESQRSFVYPYPSVSDFAGRNSDHGPSKTQTKTQTTPKSVFSREKKNSDHGLSFWGRKTLGVCPPVLQKFVLCILFLHWWWGSWGQQIQDFLLKGWAPAAPGSRKTGQSAHAELIQAGRLFSLKLMVWVWFVFGLP